MPTASVNLSAATSMVAGSVAGVAIARPEMALQNIRSNALRAAVVAAIFSYGAVLPFVLIHRLLTSGDL